MKRLVAYIRRLLAPEWLSRKLEGLRNSSTGRFRDAKSEDFLENYYEEIAPTDLEIASKEEIDARN